MLLQKCIYFSNINLETKEVIDLDNLSSASEGLPVYDLVRSLCYLLNMSVTLLNTVTLLVNQYSVLTCFD